LFSYTSASADPKGFAGTVLQVKDEEVDSRKLKAKNRTEAGTWAGEFIASRSWRAALWRFRAWFSTRRSYHARWRERRSNEGDVDASCRCGEIYFFENNFLRDDSKDGFTTEFAEVTQQRGA
jgi:hypothetical protein